MVKALLFGLVLHVVCTCALAASIDKKPPNWIELPSQYKELLAPLEPRWNGFTPQRRRMWMDIAKSYPAMPADEQAKVERRLQRWVKLTAAERKEVRESFKKLQKLPPDRKQALRQQWEEYNALPEEERRKIEESAPVSRSAAKKNPRQATRKEIAPK